MAGLPRPVPVERDAARTTILVVEDEPRIREIITLYLDRAGFAVVAVDDGRAALDAFDVEPPDLVVIDLVLPGLAGEALIAAIRDISDVPILVASAKRADEDRIDAFRLGADDYVTKPFNPVELVARVKAILRRAQPVALRATRELSFADGRLRLQPMTRRFTLDGTHGRLTPTECRILLALAAVPGVVLGRGRLLAIATRGVSETDRTVDVHVANLRRKLGDDPDRPWAIETVLDAGYRWIATADAIPATQPTSDAKPTA